MVIYGQFIWHKTRWYQLPMPATLGTSNGEEMMLKHFYTDLVTEAQVPARQAYRFFAKINDWKDWSGAIADARLFGGEWKKGAFLMFAPKLDGLPALPIVVRLLDVQPDRSISWGLQLPGARMVHRFSFIPVSDSSCRIHHEEWSEGLMTLLVWPAGRLIRKFNDRFAAELAAMF